MATGNEHVSRNPARWDGWMRAASETHLELGPHELVDIVENEDGGFVPSRFVHPVLHMRPYLCDGGAVISAQIDVEGVCVQQALRFTTSDDVRLMRAYM